MEGIPIKKNVAQTQILEKTQFLQKINLGAEHEQKVNITRYFNPNELKEPPDKESFLKVLHLNIPSFPYHCSALHSLLSECNIGFDAKGITESQIKRNQKALSNIETPSYKVRQCSTESAHGGVLLYIKNNTIYKVKNDLKMYKSKNLEFIFIEIIEGYLRYKTILCHKAALNGHRKIMQSITIMRRPTSRKRKWNQLS